MIIILFSFFTDDAAKEQQHEERSSENQFEHDAAMKNVTASIMTEAAVKQSAVLFLLAGFDTTSHTLSMVAYYLATHPEIQELAREEVDALVADLGEKEDLDYDDIGRLEYIEMVIYESMRYSSMYCINTSYLPIC